MILWFLGLTVIGLYLSFIMMKRSSLRSTLIAVFGIGVVGSLLLITLNYPALFEHLRRKHVCLPENASAIFVSRLQA